MNHPSSEPQQDNGVVNQDKAITDHNSESTSNTDQRFVRWPGGKPCFPSSAFLLQ